MSPITVWMRITVGPDETMPGVVWMAQQSTPTNEWDSYDSGGSTYGPRTDDPDRWLAYVKGQYRNLGIRWSLAKVEPYGWSQGKGHAPHGVVITVPRVVR